MTRDAKYAQLCPSSMMWSQSRWDSSLNMNHVAHTMSVSEGILSLLYLLRGIPEVLLNGLL